MANEGEYTWNMSVNKIHEIMKKAVLHKKVVTITAYPDDIVFTAEGAIPNHILTTYYGHTVDGGQLVTVRPEGENGTGAPYVSVGV